MKLTICAEIGSNHLGNLDYALAHIEEAARCGATAVKIQLFRADSLDARPAMHAALRPLEVPFGWLPILRQAAHAHDLLFGISPFAEELISECAPYADFLKISAYDLTYDDLIITAVRTGLPLVLSTAMATNTEIMHALNHIRKGRSISQSHFLVEIPHIVLLHGVAQYPCSAEDMNLNALRFLRDRLYVPPYENGAIGLSDHTLGEEAACLAVVLGATWFEKHFCLPALEGVPKSPDFCVSIDPQGLRSYVLSLHRSLKILGKGGKTGPLPQELPLFETCRRTNQKKLRG